MVEPIIDNRVIIIISQEDIAGKNMLTFLLDKTEFIKSQVKHPDNWPAGEYFLYTSDNVSILEIPESQIFTDYLKGFLNTDLIIFASKHSSAAGKKSLLVHTTGNWNEEGGHGGRDFELAYVLSPLLAYGYKRIKQLQDEYGLDEYWTGFECTHHGPTALDYPVAYFETGGTEEEWSDLDACSLITDAIWDSISKFITGELNQQKTFIGIGGNHYCSSFVKRIDETQEHWGHVIPKYAHNDAPTDIMQQAYEKTIAEEKFFLIDKNGTRSADRQRFIDFIETNGWNWEYV